MRRRFQGLSETTGAASDQVPDGIFLVRIERAQYRHATNKPYYFVRFLVLQPKLLASRAITGRVYWTPKALWTLSWFLRDFGYDTELFGQDEIEDKRLTGLTGVVKTSHVVRNGTSLLNLDAFAPAGQWDELCSASNPQPRSLEEAS